MKTAARTITLFWLVSCWAVQATAAPLVFSSTQFDTSTVALAGALADTDFGSSPPAALPLISSTSVVASPDFASGNAVGAVGLLSTLAEASSASGLSSASGTVEFIGSFTAPGGLIALFLDLSLDDFTDPSAASSSTALLRLTSSGMTVIDELFSATGVIQRNFNLAAGAPSVLDLLLISEASTSTGGDAFTAATLSFRAETLAVPEPHSLAITLFALLVLGSFRRRER